MKIFIFVVLFLFLIAPASAQDQTPIIKEAGPFPKNYAKIIKDYLHENAFDPDSVKIFEITKPVPAETVYKSMKGMMIKEKSWECYVTWNAKNRMGGYSGKSKSRVLIVNNKIDHFSD